MLIYRYKQRLKEAQHNEQEEREAKTWGQEGYEVEKKQETPQEEAKTLEDKTVPELKELAKVQGIDGYSNMKKEALIEAIKEGD